MKNIVYKVWSLIACMLLIPLSSAFAQNENQLTLGDLSIRGGETADVIVNLNNTELFSGFQFDITLGEGLTMVDNSFVLNSSRIDKNFTLSSSHRDNGDYRVLVGSMPVSKIPSGQGELLRFKVKAAADFSSSSVTIKNALFTTTDLKEVKLDDTTAPVSFAFVKVETINLSKNSASMMIDETLALQATVLPDNADDRSITWTSSAPGVASVSADGVVTALSVGTATITATANDGSNVSASCVVNVTTNIFSLVYLVDGAIYQQFELKYGADITPLESPSKEGHTFSGWSEIPATMPNHDVNVTGTFSVNSYKLTYVVDGEIYSESTVEFCTSITPIDAPVKEGHTFSGWSEVPATMPAHDVTITGSFSVNKYKLIYKVDDEIVSSEEVEYGAAITPLAEPKKEGETFSGWSTIPATMPAHDVTITGTFSTNAYKLTYVVDDEVYSESTVEFGTSITPIDAPVKEGHTFSGWSEIPATMPAHDVTITASFSVNKYKLIYKVDDEIVSSEEMEYGAAITPLAEPKKEGETFSGWSTIPASMPAHDVTITGTFSTNAYKLTYVVDGEVYNERMVAFGTSITAIDAPSKEGYTFTGWSEIPATMPAKDVTITGSFTVNKYKLIYKVDDEIVSSEEVEYGATITPLAEPKKEGETFSGWSTIPATMPAKDVTIIGSFSVNSYTITYMYAGKVVNEVSVKYGAQIPAYEYAPENDERYTYTFVGWSIDGSEFTETTMPAKNLVLEAKVDVVDDINSVLANATIFNVYTLTGARLMVGAPKEKLKSLSSGIYIINGKKISVRR